MINYINSQDLEFYISEGGLLCLIYKETDLGRVGVSRMFPFQFDEEYISVRPENHLREDSENELGIIRNLADLPQKQRELLNMELKKRYFMPDITEIENIKEEFGNISFEVITTAGKRNFTVTDMSSNIRTVGKNRVMLTDVYGNRFCIPDITLLKDKELKVLEIWI